jgi:hypothetical protein
VTASLRVKYPRTPHLPSSPGSDDDDIPVAPDASLFSSDDVVVTLKLDGENTTVYSDGSCHARSLDSAYHPSRTWMRARAAMLGLDLPGRLRVCGENMFARHSIAYDDLDDWFYLFSVWDTSRSGGSTGYDNLSNGRDTDGGVALSWDETVEWAQLLSVPHVPVIYRGVFDQAAVTQAFEPFRQVHEGYVVRVAGEVPAARFKDLVAKWVRPGHVTTDQHWLSAPVVPNGRRHMPRD